MLLQAKRFSVELCVVGNTSQKPGVIWDAKYCKKNSPTMKTVNKSEAVRNYYQCVAYISLVASVIYHQFRILATLVKKADLRAARWRIIN